jgi:hypothetical protein
VGPTQQEMVEQVEALARLSDKMISKTPWEVSNDSFDYKAEIDNVLRSHIMFCCFSFNPTNIMDRCYSTKTNINALITVLAVLRYYQDSGRYPESLQQLVKADYLQALPMDSYSDGPLAYRVTGNNFTLYSVGEDFVDNDGTAITGAYYYAAENKIIELNQPDVIYWPIYRAEDFYGPPPIKYFMF